ncbi:non-canonical purine NTP pyrophosphatase, RdgB/HAM1 family [candidate division CPR3 bacterium GWF2_35_18]|uniref:dITP/XTP pyrophosphatase n=1 Tax=candidate division CPR3 bacterium GW2011_GWF2_35_18 TaxID=1618350 RepID=A0A0G0BLI9_UNCC3|nr:MAG: Non-canonical purine NTP pyrophosphatase [candidate division CPR3 bacterium GW2011_GWF2_35_18]KKP85550.1 MAG: Non-canonical purine NTP pyrophosphatase [candidate division CPR3 bacterium GW2011_GWE2_35_7]OGB63503.1 MAG: non-canonical purine NTP pyrophosphatase, RdgB/HAM1 family [candidate division CPR3 bacterium GWF2_35_18]OGB64752.1 MAG: non-canonical purine NTP pyrophosphatase, RdgB/HAM1 family [candidate division CPR3 bacterium RIFOXYA2_FULL_35_13]OGB77381.1 MAG: non-canonical purine 
MLKILFATTNPGKIRELQEVFSGMSVEILSIKDFNNHLPHKFEAIESGKTFIDNAEIKSKTYGEKLNILTVADDSGLEVKALDGRPGVFSKRYGNSDEERNRRLLNELQEVPKSNRTARFVCALSLYDPNNRKCHTVEGIMQGKISYSIQGAQGFGYDPIFINETGKTNAEISLQKKNQISHRGKAFRKLKIYIQKNYKI